MRSFSCIKRTHDVFCRCFRFEQNENHFLYHHFLCNVFLLSIGGKAKRNGTSAFHRARKQEKARNEHTNRTLFAHWNEMSQNSFPSAREMLVDVDIRRSLLAFFFLVLVYLQLHHDVDAVTAVSVALTRLAIFSAFGEFEKLSHTNTQHTQRDREWKTQNRTKWELNILCNHNFLSKLEKRQQQEIIINSALEFISMLMILSALTSPEPK